MALVCMKFLLVEICDMFSGIWRLGIVPSDFCETYMLLLVILWDANTSTRTSFLNAKLGKSLHVRLDTLFL
jgi:hypothetical protein